MIAWLIGTYLGERWDGERVWAQILEVETCVFYAFGLNIDFWGSEVYIVLKRWVYYKVIPQQRH